MINNKYFYQTVNNNPLSFALALEGTDPLSKFARQAQELNDPLTQMANELVGKLQCLFCLSL